MKLIKYTLPVVLTCIVTAASAQYAGPGATAPYSSVADILKNATDDTRVELEGTIIRQVGKDKFIFTDGKTEIRIEINEKHMPVVKIDERTKVRIRGEVEKDFMESPEIDVDAVTVVK